MVTPDRPHVVVMGVSGTGKSTIAAALAREHGWDFVEGDDFHPRGNVAKMRAGTPLTDDDRWPWLDALAARLARAGEGRVVLTCSALRRAYRDVLRGPSAPGEVFFLHLSAAEDVLAARMRAREHFMPPALLHSQLEALEPLQHDELGATLDVDAPVAEILEGSARVLGQDPVG